LIKQARLRYREGDQMTKTPMPMKPLGPVCCAPIVRGMTVTSLHYQAHYEAPFVRVV